MNTKLAIAALCALFGVALATWVGTTQLGGRKSPQSASRAAEAAGESPRDSEAASRVRLGEPKAEDSPPPAWIVENEQNARAKYTFPKAKTPGEAGTAIDSQFAAFENAIDENAELAEMTVSKRMGVAASWRSLMRPLIAGDQPGFVAAAGELGGLTESGEEGQSPADALYTRLAEYLEGAPVDLSSARVRKADPNNPGELPSAPKLPKGMVPQGPGVMMMVSIQASTDDDGGETQTSRSIDLPMGSLFPDAARALEDGAQAVEVWTPTRMSKSRAKGADLGTSVFFVWNKEARAWQPIAMRINLMSAAANKKLNAMMRGGPGQTRKTQP